MVTACLSHALSTVLCRWYAGRSEQQQPSPASICVRHEPAAGQGTASDAHAAFQNPDNVQLGAKCLHCQDICPVAWGQD